MEKLFEDMKMNIYTDLDLYLNILGKMASLIKLSSSCYMKIFLTELFNYFVWKRRWIIIFTVKKIVLLSQKF